MTYRCPSCGRSYRRHDDGTAQVWHVFPYTPCWCWDAFRRYGIAFFPLIDAVDRQHREVGGAVS